MQEVDIEHVLLGKFEELQYTVRNDIRDRAGLEANFRTHFNRFNGVVLSDDEFERLLGDVVTADVYAASQILRERHTFIRDDETPLHYGLIDGDNWCKNSFEVVHQLQINTRNSHQRYDVMLLINGLPLVHIELKSLDRAARKAMEQIVRYKREPGNGYGNTLLCFVQIFIVSNAEHTYYFANNNEGHFAFHADERFLPKYTAAGRDNAPIGNVFAFADHSLKKSVLCRLICRYMVLIASERRLIIMRPYQIYAVEAIIDCIEHSRENSYVWHTTGSGKTLTSFKASTLLRNNRDIEKCLFVVDRKDLDRQTREEFNRFQEGCVEENTNTKSLVRRLLSRNHSDKVIVTTIQKLALALSENADTKHRRGAKTFKEQLAPLQNKRLCIIFDECHRSQFGENHRAIKEFFPKAQLFGFTGTPIFRENAQERTIAGNEVQYKTTQSIFPRKLHEYTITHAIADETVLRFKIEYHGAQAQQKGEIPYGTAGAPAGSISKAQIVRSILKNHDAFTMGGKFNALFATASINDAIAYYNLFKTEQGVSTRPLRVACVFSPPAAGNVDIRQLQEDLPQERADNSQNADEKKQALAGIIADYNEAHGSNFGIDDFDAYYKDIQKRIKDHQYAGSRRSGSPVRASAGERAISGAGSGKHQQTSLEHHQHQHKTIDITIVVDMLLTGFDSKYVNTLYVDKPLKHHRLIQAFSRTNRVLNNTKPFGNIVDYRNTEQAVKDAIALFSGLDRESAEELWLADPAETLVRKYTEVFGDLKGFMESKNLDCTPSNVYNLRGVAAQCAFIEKFRELQKLKICLDQYSDLTTEQQDMVHEPAPNYTLSRDSLRSFRSAYLHIAENIRRIQEEQAAPAGLSPYTSANTSESENAGEVHADVDAEGMRAVEQLDLELVLLSSATVDYDYIMNLMAQYSQQREVVSREALVDIITSTSNFMDERASMLAYIETLAGRGFTVEDVQAGYEEFKNAEFSREIESIAQAEGIDPAALKAFAQSALQLGIFEHSKIDDLLAPLQLGWRQRVDKEDALTQKLKPLLLKRAQGRDIRGLSAHE